MRYVNRGVRSQERAGGRSQKNYEKSVSRRPLWLLIPFHKNMKGGKGVVMVIVLGVEIGRRKGAAGVGGEPRKMWPWTHWRRRDRRANAGVPTESMLFLISMTLLKDGQGPEDQIRDSAWGLGFSFKSFPTTQHSLVFWGAEWRCET